MKLVVRLLVALVLLLALAGTAFWLKFPAVGPAPDLKVEITPEKVERGRYVANHVAVCIDCHSHRDFKFLAGPVVPGTEGEGGERFGPEMGIPGELYAPNITPANLGGWSDGQILRAFTEGVTWQGQPLFPLMPYPSYRHMSREDAEAVIAYLRSLQPKENVPPASRLDFPLNLIVRMIPKPAAPETPDPKDTVAYGRYLVKIGACSDCHTPRQEGQPIESMFLAGGNEFVLPDGVVSRSANITPVAGSAVATRDRRGFVALFKQYASPEGRARPVPPGGFNTVMPWTKYAGMTEEDLGAIYDYLKTVAPVENKVQTFTAAGAKS